MKKTSALVVLFMLLFGTVVSILSPAAKADDDGDIGDIGRFLVCDLFKFDGMTQSVYEIATTDKFAYLTRSRSITSSGVGNVDGAMNGVLRWGREGTFGEVNKPIIGYDPSAPGISATSDEKEESYNGGKPVSVYQRFGISGLQLTNYLGEWKYVAVDVCAKEAEDASNNAWYEGREEPKETWTTISDSKDVRTLRIQDTGSEIWLGITNAIHSFILGAMKFLFVVTAALVNFAFNDIVSSLKLDTFVYGDGNVGSGVVGTIFNSFYFPLIGLVMAVAGLSAVISAVRGSSKLAFRRIVVSVAVAISAAATYFLPHVVLALPNNVAVIGQAIVVSGVAPTLGGNGVLCSPGAGSGSEAKETGVRESNLEDTSDVRLSLDELGDQIVDTVTCSLWEFVLLDPWAKAQFGDHWDNLYANEHSKNKKKTLGNSGDNSEMVGDAEVPLGGGKKINNWAIYQLSTQTNAHANSSKDGSMPTRNSGLNDDFYRVVDAMANIHYADVEYRTADGEKHTIKEPRETAEDQPNKNWRIWTGLDHGHRTGVLLEALLVNVFLLAPVVFLSGLAAIYAIGLVILMAFLPIFLLAGATGGEKGVGIMKEYLNLIISTTVSRIMIGFVLIIALMLVFLARSWMETESYIQGLLFIVFMSFGIKKFWPKVKELTAGIGFSTGTSSGLRSVSERASRSLAQGARAVGGVATAASTGGLYAAMKKNKGKSPEDKVSMTTRFKKGFSTGGKEAIENVMYKSPAMRQAFLVKQDIDSRSTGTEEWWMKNCSECGARLEDFMGQQAAMTHDGEYLCPTCASMRNPDTYTEYTVKEEVRYEKKEEKSPDQRLIDEYDRVKMAGSSSEIGAAFRRRMRATDVSGASRKAEKDKRRFLAKKHVSHLVAAVAREASVQRDNMSPIIADISGLDKTGRMVESWRDAKAGKVNGENPHSFEDFVKYARRPLTMHLTSLFEDMDYEEVDALVADSLRKNFVNGEPKPEKIQRFENYEEEVEDAEEQIADETSEAEEKQE